jgi:hypothetical protein
MTTLYTVYLWSDSVSTRRLRHSLYPRNDKKHCVCVNVKHYSIIILIHIAIRYVRMRKDRIFFGLSQALNIIILYIRIACARKSTRAPVLYVP